MRGASLWNTTKMIVNELGARGFNVQCIVSDMGGSNQAMWKCAGIVSNRFAKFQLYFTVFSLLLTFQK